MAKQTLVYAGEKQHPYFKKLQKNSTSGTEQDTLQERKKHLQSTFTVMTT